MTGAVLAQLGGNADEVLDNSIVIYTSYEKRRSSLTVDIDDRADLDAAVIAMPSRERIIRRPDITGA